MQDFRKLEVWRRAHELALAIYRATSGFPESEKFGLTVQMRRAAVSVGSNIAEGTGRSTPRDFARFLDLALGSVTELQYQLIIVADLRYLDPEPAARLQAAAEQVKRMLTSLVQRVRGHQHEIA